MTSNWGWVSTQLNGVEAESGVQEAVVQLLQALDEVTNDYALLEDDRRRVLEYTQKLALGYALVADAPDETWGDVIPGEYNVRDTVRVREDAYLGTHGRKHNGKRGRVSAIHQGKVVVIYEDAKNSEESYYHEPEKLQRLV